jgi:hypothetical protein
MPSQVLTKRRVKRRQQRLRLVSKNAKRKVRSSVRKHRKTAKKVMRGGAPEVRQYCLFIYPGTDEEIRNLYVDREKSQSDKDKIIARQDFQDSKLDSHEHKLSDMYNAGVWKNERSQIEEFDTKMQTQRHYSKNQSPKYCIPYSSRFLFARITEVVDGSVKEVYISNTGDFFQDDWLEKQDKNEMLKQLVLKLFGINMKDSKTFKAVSEYKDLWHELPKDSMNTERAFYSVIKVTKKITPMGGTHTISLRYSNHEKWRTIGNFTPDQKVRQIFETNNEDEFMSFVKKVLTQDLELSDGTPAPATATSADIISTDSHHAAANNPRFRLEKNPNFNIDYANDVRLEVTEYLMDWFELLYRTDENHNECKMLRNKYLPKYDPKNKQKLDDDDY